MGSAIAAYLLKAGLSQEDFSRLVGVHSGVVSRWVSGERTPRGDMAVAIEQATAGALRVEDVVGKRRRRRKP